MDPGSHINTWQPTLPLHQVLKLPACLTLFDGDDNTWSRLVAACADEHKVYVIAGEESGECRGEILVL